MSTPTNQPPYTIAKVRLTVSGDMGIFLHVVKADGNRSGICLGGTPLETWAKELLAAPTAVPGEWDECGPIKKSAPPHAAGETPRTDALHDQHAPRENPVYCYDVMVAHARTLERELNEATERGNRFSGKYADEMVKTADLRASLARLAIERDEAHAQLAAVEKERDDLQQALVDEREDLRREYEATIAELSTDGNAVTLAASLAKVSQQLAAARADSERLDWLELMADHAKWEDFCPGLRPIDTDGDYIAKYVGENGATIRAAIDAARQQEGSK